MTTKGMITSNKSWATGLLFFCIVYLFSRNEIQLWYRNVNFSAAVEDGQWKFSVKISKIYTHLVYTLSHRFTLFLFNVSWIFAYSLSENLNWKICSITYFFRLSLFDFFALLLMNVVILVYLLGGMAEQLYSSLQTPEARLAILLGTTKYKMFSRTSQVLLNRGGFFKKRSITEF